LWRAVGHGVGIGVQIGIELPPVGKAGQAVGHRQPAVFIVQALQFLMLGGQRLPDFTCLLKCSKLMKSTRIRTASTSVTLMPIVA
jgi:hypothetical protein